MQVFSNNAATTLAAELSAVATSMTVTASTGFAALTSPQFELVTIDDGTAREIVKVTARSGTTWTVERGQEGTTAALWDAGVSVEARVTAGTLAAFVAGQALMAYNAAGGDAIGQGAISMQPARAASSSVALGAGSIAIGENSAAAEDNAIAVGYNAGATAWGSIAIGASTAASGDLAVAVGNGADAARDGVALGRMAYALSRGAIAIGRDAYSDTNSDDAVALGNAAYCGANAPGASALGRWSYANAESSTAVGDTSYANGLAATAMGFEARAEAEKSLAIGADSIAQDPYCAHISALLRHTAAANFETSNPAARLAQTAFFSAPVISLMSPVIDLAATGSVDLVLPANTQFFVDTIGLIVVSAATPAGSPAISVHDLTSELVTVTTAGQRQIWKDIDGDAVTGTITVTVNTALTSGALSARVYLSGIAVQV